MFWRCFVVYQGTRLVSPSKWHSRSCLVIPFSFLSASVGMGILLLSELIPRRTRKANIMLLSFMSITLSLNVPVTALIVRRLFAFKQRVSTLLGSGFGSRYVSIIALVVESAAIVVFFDVWFLAAFIKKNNSSVAFQVLVQVQTLSPFIIIFRVAQGKA